jgi:hypothetical protein
VRYIAFSAVALAGCGGGGSPVAVKPRAAPLQVAYYGALDETVPEQVAETGVIWSNGWGPEGFDVHLDRQLTIAKQFGAQEAIILVDTILQQDGGEEARVRTILDRLRAKGLLAWRRFTFFVVDEPEQQGFSAAMLAAATAKLHAIIADYPELAGAQLETNYGCANDFRGRGKLRRDRLRSLRPQRHRDAGQLEGQGARQARATVHRWGLAMEGRPAALHQARPVRRPGDRHGLLHPLHGDRPRQHV